MDIEQLKEYEIVGREPIQRLPQAIVIEHLSQQ